MNPREIQIVARPLKQQPEIAVSWAYPNSYSVGMSGLGFQLIWWLLEQDVSLAVKRVFTDYQESGWQNSELLGFTLSWELDYVNVLNLLDKIGTAKLSADRSVEQPIVFGGGPVLSANPEPFAEIFDVVLLGDAEVLIPAFIEKWKEVRSFPSRAAKLEALADVDGIYVPSLYRYKLMDASGPLAAIEPMTDKAPGYIKRQMFTAPKDYVAHSVVLTEEGSWGDMFLAEVVRSCPQECRFCLASYLTRPFRGANIDTLMEKIELGLRHTKKIGLLGPSVTEHPQFSELAERLLRKDNLEISVASIRIDTIDPLVLKMLVALGQKSVTIALESGSERLRAIMKKKLSEEQVLYAMENIAASGLNGVKLYGIAGLPGETAEDIEETIRLLTLLKKKHKQLRITFGISSFVPKAQTPFQWAGRDKSAGKKIEHIRKHLAKTGIDVRPESDNWSNIQALLSRGDRRLTPVLLNVAASAGNLGAWKRALKNLPAGCPGEDFYVYRDIPLDEPLAWRHLMDDAKATMLQRHNSEARQLAAEQSPLPSANQPT